MFSIKKVTLFLLVFTMMFYVTCLSVYAASDISDSWGKDIIQEWLDKGLISGYPDGSFKPDNNITRAEFMALVNNALGYTETTTINFSDVKPGDWFYETVAIAKAAGYIDGYPDGTMKPNNPISREEAATIIMKIYNLTPDEEAANDLADAQNFTWSKGAIGAVLNANIMTGYPDGTFGAQIFIKRVEATVSLDRGNKNLIEDETNPVTPKAPDVTVDDDEDTVSGMTTKMEYKLDSGSWKMYVKDTFDDLDLSGKHTLLVRYAAEGINPVGPITTLEFTKKVISAGGGGGGSSSVRATDISILGDSSVEKYLTLQLTVTFIPANTTNKTITWTVDTLASGTATISTSGLLTATGTGTVTVTATNTASGVTETKVITITNVAITNATAAVVDVEESYLQDDLDDAQDLVTALPSCAEKTALQARIDTAQAVIDANVALAEAKASVPADLTIYTDATADAVTTAMALPEVTTINKTDKAEAINEAVALLLTKAEEAIMIATAAVEDAEKSNLQIDLDAAQTLVTALPDGTTKDGLQDRIDNVQDIIDLAQAKATAHTALTNAFSTYDEDDYTESNWATLYDFKTTGDEAIDDATTPAEVTAAQTAAINGMVAVETIAQVDEAQADAHDTLNDAYASFNSIYYTGTNWLILLGYYTDGSVAIDDATDLSEVSTALQTALNGMVDVPTMAGTEQAAVTAVQYAEAHPTQDNIDTAQPLVSALPNGAAKTILQNRLNLVQAKVTAFADLVTALAGYTAGDYSVDNWTALNNAKTAGDTAISNATTIANVTTAKNNAIDAMDVVQTLAEQLLAAKNAAHLELADTMVDRGFYGANYSEDNWDTIWAIKTAADDAINLVTTIEELSPIIEDALDDMDEIPTLAEELAEAKTAAHTALTETLALYTESDYTSENWTTLTGYKTTGDIAINAAGTIADVTTAKNTAINGMDSVQTKAEQLATAKTAAHTALDVAMAGYTEDYTEENWILLTGYKVTGDTAIDSATTIADVTTARDTTLTAMDAVQTIAEELTAAKTAAHTALTNALAGYTETDYSGANWTTLTGYKTTGDTEVNAATTIADVTTAKNTAIDSMAAVQTVIQELAAAKSAAHDALDEALAGYHSSDYTGAGWLELIGYKEQGDEDIDNAISVLAVNTARDIRLEEMDDVLTIVENEEEALAAVEAAEADPTEENIAYAEAFIAVLPDGLAKDELLTRIAVLKFNNAKTNALATLEAAYEDYNDDDYTAGNWTTLVGYYDDGIDAINAAVDIDEINEALTTAIEGMASVTMSATVYRSEGGDGTVYIYYELSTGSFNTETVINTANWSTLAFTINHIDVVDSTHLIITSDSILHSGWLYQLTPAQVTMTTGYIAPNTRNVTMVTFPTVNSSATSNFSDSNTITVEIITGDVSFNSATATNTANWTLGGTNVADLGTIQSVGLSYENHCADITLSGTVKNGGNYTIIYTQSTLGPGYSAPTTPLTVYDL
jgi:hypothetical protein